jgi:phospholipid transport system substrate-binding protein
MAQRISRRLALRLAAAGLLGLSTARARAQAGGPTEPVTTLNEGIIGILRAGRATPFDQRLQTFMPVVQRAFDLPAVLQATVGLRYSSFTPEQQAELLAVFTQFTAASYVANFDQYDGQRFEVSPTLRRVGQDDVVSSQLVTSGGTTRFDYVVRPADGAYKIVDVLLDGSISRVAVQRSDFRSVLASNGAPALIAMLQSKVANLAAGNRS